jgi:hypothetical protein
MAKTYAVKLGFQSSPVPIPRAERSSFEVPPPKRQCMFPNMPIRHQDHEVDSSDPPSLNTASKEHCNRENSFVSEPSLAHVASQTKSMLTGWQSQEVAAQSSENETHERDSSRLLSSLDETEMMDVDSLPTVGGIW